MTIRAKDMKEEAIRFGFQAEFEEGYIIGNVMKRMQIAKNLLDVLPDYDIARSTKLHIKDIQDLRELTNIIYPGDENTLINFDTLYKRAKSVIDFRELSGSAQAGSVGAAILTDKGNIYLGTCIDTSCGMGFCAEQAAAAAMITAGENNVEKLIAVNSEGKILPPCGRCREFISQLGPNNLNAEVMVKEDTIVKLKELLPYDWREE